MQVRRTVAASGMKQFLWLQSDSFKRKKIVIRNNEWARNIGNWQFIELSCPVEARHECDVTYYNTRGRV